MIKFLRKNLFKMALVATLVVIPVISFAQATIDPCDPTKGMICNPISANSIQAFIQTFLVGIIKIGMPIVALAIIYCGFLFVEARGNTEKLTKAKSALLYTIIGAAILLGSWAIAGLIANTVLVL